MLAETHGSWRSLVDPVEFKRQRRVLPLDDHEPRSLYSISVMPTPRLTTATTPSTAPDYALSLVTSTITVDSRTGALVTHELPVYFVHPFVRTFARQLCRTTGNNG